MAGEGVSKRDNPEQRLQIAVAQYLAHALKPPAFFTAFPAGGGGRLRGAFLKAMGLRAGMPDLLIFAPGPNVIGIELKSKAGRMTPAQMDVSSAFAGCSMWLVLCRSVDEVERALRFCKVPLSATVARAA